MGSPAQSIDLSHLDRYTGGDRTLNTEVLDLFRRQYGDLIAKLGDIVAAGDAKSWREITHTLKGAAKGVGAFAFAETARQAEDVDIGDVSAAREAIARLRTDAHAITAFIGGYLKV